MANEQIICNGDCVAGQDYTPVEDTSIVLKYPDGEVTTSVPISFTVEEVQTPEESYLHTWSLLGAEACTGETQWVSPEPVSSYTIEEVDNTQSINGLPDTEYFPDESEVTIEWNGYTYTTTQPPVKYLLYDLNIHGLIFSQVDPAYAQMVATLDPDSTDYTTFEDSRGTIVVFHKAIDYARGGWGYTKDTTTLNSLQINAGFTIPADGICRLNVPLVGASTLFFDFPDSNPSSGSTFTCPSMSNPRFGSWAYFVYDSTGLVQFEYRITSRISSLPDFTPVTITAGGGVDYVLTFLPQGQTFTFGAECEPTNVVINQEDPNAPTTTAYKLTVFKEGTLVVEKTYETDPTPLISIVSNSIKYILKIFGTDLQGNEIEKEYSFIDFDPTSIPGAFNITRLPYSELKINEGVCDLTINSPTYGEFSCVTTAPYTLPVESGPVNAIKLFDGDTQEWEVKYFDGSGNVLGTDTFQQEPIIQGNELLGNDFVLAVDPLTGIEYVIPNPITSGGIEPTQTILPGTNLVVDGQEYTVSGIRLDPINPELIPPEVITPTSRPVENTNLDFNFADYTTGDLAFDAFNNWGSVLNTSTPTTTFTLQGQGTQNQLVLRVPPFDPNVAFNTLGDEANNNLRRPSTNNRPVINLNKQQPIVQCDCPDATKTRRYLSAGEEKGLTVSWENSGAGAKEVLGVKGCKHAYSVLIANGLEQPYKPVDAQPDIVPNQYGIQPPIIGDDVSDYFDDNIGIPKEGFNMPRNKGRQRFL